MHLLKSVLQAYVVLLFRQEIINNSCNRNMINTN